MEITSKRLGATSVIKASGKMAGIITDGDLRRMLNQHAGEALFHLKASDIMTVNPISVGSQEYAVKALEIMQARSITQVVVVENEEIVGFVHLHDLLREGLV